jgi:acyl-CoA dehydrogenase
MILLARTTPVDRARSRTDGLQVFLVDVRNAIGHSMTVRPLRTMLNHETHKVFSDGLRHPETALIGEQGGGFRYILEGINAERILIASECIGDGYWFIDHASAYACQRVVFDRPIGATKGSPSHLPAPMRVSGLPTSCG